MEKVYQFKTLLGHKNLDFSIQCLQSFLEKSEDKISLEVFDDGTINGDDRRKLSGRLDNISVVLKDTRDGVVREKLAPFPHCLAYRDSNPYAQKLFDVMLCDESDLFFIDSDVYFIRRFSLPDVGHFPVFIRDGQNAYSFNPSQFVNIRFPIIGRVNTGLFFFPFEHYDLHFLERLLADSLIQKGYERIFWMEQTLWAFLAGRVSGCQFFDDAQIKMSKRNLSIDDSTVAVHLVSSFRFQFEYLRALQLSERDVPDKIRLQSSTRVLDKYQFAVDRIKKGIYRRMGIFQ